MVIVPSMCEGRRSCRRCQALVRTRQGAAVRFGSDRAAAARPMRPAGYPDDSSPPVRHPVWGWCRRTST
jgi:hypothetical protein